MDTQNLIDAGELQKNDDLLDAAQHGDIEAAVRSLPARCSLMKIPAWKVTFVF